VDTISCVFAKGFAWANLGESHWAHFSLSERLGVRVLSSRNPLGRKKILKDGTNILELYHIRSPHDDGMLIVYLPKLKLIVESDLVNGPPRPNPFETHLAAELERLKLDYVAFVPAHQPNPDQEVPKSELMKRVAEAAQSGKQR
jgi:hypothetical protein